MLGRHRERRRIAHDYELVALMPKGEVVSGSRLAVLTVAMSGSRSEAAGFRIGLPPSVSVALQVHVLG